MRVGSRDMGLRGGGLIVRWHVQGPMISMSASLGGASSAPCSLMLTPSHCQEASTTGSNAK